MIADTREADYSKAMTRMHQLFLILLSVVLTGCFLLPKEEQALEPPLIEPPAPTYRTVEVVRGPIEHEVIVTGTYEFTTQYSVYFTYKGGRLQSLQVKYSDDVKRGQLIAEIEADSLLTDIELQEISVDRAEIMLTKRKIEENRLEIRLAELDLKTAQVRLRDLRTALKQRRIYAPIDGRIVYVAPLNIGDFVEPYQVVARVADPTEMLITYGGAEASLFKIDYPVEIRIGDETYSGIVVMTPSTAPERLPESQRQRVLIRPIDTPFEKLERSFIVVRAVLARKDDVVVVPRRGVREYQNSFFVHVLDNNVRMERRVEIGMETPTNVEIIKGLDEGELLILQ